jgi:outer membrane protein OmpA-like peptidoglycan-associated protein
LLKLAAALLALSLAAGCASEPVAPALFAVLPAPDGHIGTIVVQRDGERRVVNTAYGAQRLKADGSLEATQLSADQVKAQFGSTLAALPGAPATFTLYFRQDSDELTPRSTAELERIFAEIKRRPLPDIVVIGHTDTVGGLRYNDRLSLARAGRMREMLIELGIPPERIQARGRGERELLVPTEDEVSEPRNRRVEINVR